MSRSGKAAIKCVKPIILRFVTQGVSIRHGFLPVFERLSSSVKTCFSAEGSLQILHLTKTSCSQLGLISDTAMNIKIIWVHHFTSKPTESLMSVDKTTD